MRKITLFTILFFILLHLGCETQQSKPLYVTTIPPVAAILREIVGTKGEVSCLLSNGASPHTYSVQPSDVFKVQSAKAFFYVSDILDGWVSKIPSNNKIMLIDLIPKDNLISFNGQEHSHSHNSENEAEPNHNLENIDPHFWTDPLTVKALLVKLVDTLSVLDPDNAATYKANSGIFEKRLELLDRQVSSALLKLRGKPVFLFHPSFLYLLKRYNLRYAGSIEVSPGKEPTPRYIAELSKKIRESGTKAIFTEPQLPEAPAKMIAKESSVLVYTLDPIGGTKETSKYTDLIMYNVKILQRALE